ncbi:MULTISPECIES: hypothetical protein [unclassified Acidovorax]|uniref:hypothetical protein n=1 Tax=unclassified Acidovorax TaxID=2684926 RepID=UPI002882DAE7|nr:MULTISPECIES: hypothetical protein [unclassified Acidovorax]
MTLKYAILFAHLIAMAVAVGKILEFDTKFLFQARAPMTSEGIVSLKWTQAVVSASLAVLWATGAMLVVLGSMESPDYLNNQKLWVKVGIVACLTFNGWVMHRWAFPMLQGDTAFLDLPKAHMLGLTALATASSVSWLYASFLGIARSWNHSVPYLVPAAVYAVLLLGGWAAASALLLWLRNTSKQPSGPRQNCRCLQG